MSAEQEIPDLVLRWAAAVHLGDLDAVLADHAEDVVMFDVPPPWRGVRGASAYAATWPPFFRWQAAGAEFTPVEVEVTAGADVAYVVALLRLTLGLRRDRGRWVMAHEHHSFPVA